MIVDDSVFPISAWVICGDRVATYGAGVIEIDDDTVGKQSLPAATVAIIGASMTRETGLLVSATPSSVACAVTLSPLEGFADQYSCPGAHVVGPGVHTRSILGGPIACICG